MNVGGIQHDQLIRLIYGKSPQQQCIDEAKDCGVGADAESEGENRDRREAWGFAQHTQREANVAREIVPEEPAAEFVEALLSLGDVAESAAGGVVSFLFAEALFAEACNLQLQMRFDFALEIVFLALPSEDSSEHG